MDVQIACRDNFPSEKNNNGIRINYFLDDEVEKDNNKKTEDLGQVPVFSITLCNFHDQKDDDSESWLNMEQAKLLHCTLGLFIEKYGN
jgi:hypothetical protein